MAIDFTGLFKALEGNVTDLAKQSLSDYLAQAISDGSSIVSGLRGKIENWSLQLSTGEIDPDDFKTLVLGEKDLMKMDALVQAGISLIRIDRFKIAICDMVVNTVSAIL